MKPSKKILLPVIASVLLTGSALVHAQDTGLSAVQTELTSLYQTAKVTADGMDIVSAGSVLVLQKDNLVMSKVQQPIPPINQYKDGVISQTRLQNVLSAFSGGLVKLSGDPAASPTRKFVAGEKFWVTRINALPDGVYLYLMSDPIGDQRYKGTLEIPFPKNSVPSPDDVAAMVSEVVKIDAPPPEAAPAQAAAVPVSLPTQPQTKTITLGQTRDEVIATFGVPSRILKTPVKEVDFFPDMKVTFVHDRVSDVE